MSPRRDCINKTDIDAVIIREHVVFKTRSDAIISMMMQEL